MTELSTDQLKKLFHQDIIQLYKNITKFVKYKPTRLMDFINKYGGYEAAAKYISTESNVQDFAVLWEKERLDLSVEALITNEPYNSLFPEELVQMCADKLKQYSYAPNKIEEPEEVSGYYDEEEKIDIAELMKIKETYLEQSKKKDYLIYQQASSISITQWEELLLDTKVVTANNLDLILRIYSMGDEITPKELALESGYSSTYPYKEVVMALAKRIKVKLKVDVPVGQDSKPLWWHLLFNGGMKDNTEFEWSLKSALRQAVTNLIQQAKMTPVETKTKRDLNDIKEIALVEKVPEVTATTSSDDSKSAFDLLFESIMGEPESSMPLNEKEIKTVAETPETIIAPEILPLPEIQPVEVVEEKDAEIAICETPEPVPSEENIQTPDALKAACLEYYGAICDLCGFDFGYTYGDGYEALLDVHNINVLEGSEILPDTDPIKDLVPVCHNCHHVIHSTIPPLTVEHMRKMIKA